MKSYIFLITFAFSAPFLADYFVNSQMNGRAEQQSHTPQYWNNMLEAYKHKYEK